MEAHQRCPQAPQLADYQASWEITPLRSILEWKPDSVHPLDFHLEVVVDPEAREICHL